ncbi:MAG: hypothetical protein M3542_02015 [Acidobacteriota bacterium]|nr:hypothetical protein [Acidobacteriota bacterium]
MRTAKEAFPSAASTFSPLWPGLTRLRASASAPGRTREPTPAIASASRYARFSHQRGSQKAATARRIAPAMTA